MDPSSSARRRHVWVNAGGGGQHPGLILTWRRPDGDPQAWEAQVAIVHHASVLTTWVPASALRPISDDRWELPAR